MFCTLSYFYTVSSTFTWIIFQFLLIQREIDSHLWRFRDIFFSQTNKKWFFFHFLQTQELFYFSFLFSKQLYWGIIDTYKKCTCLIDRIGWVWAYAYSWVLISICKVMDISVPTRSALCPLDVCVCVAIKNALHKIYPLNKWLSAQPHIVNHRYCVIGSLQQVMSRARVIWCNWSSIPTEQLYQRLFKLQ